MKPLKNHIKLLATGGGLGYSPIAPGTIGTMGALLISLLLLLFAQDPIINFIHIFLAVMTYVVGQYVTKIVISYWGDDPSKVVIDEYCGFWVALVFTPPSVVYYLLAFVIFRIFDISKIMGISYFDKLKTAHGVMLDDVLAGLYTVFLILIIYKLDLIPI